MGKREHNGHTDVDMDEAQAGSLKNGNGLDPGRDGVNKDEMMADVVKDGMVNGKES